MTGFLFLILAALVLCGGYFSRRRVRRVKQGRDPVVTDESLREILGGAGDADTEGSLDENEIREAEDRFWEEKWDEPEEWSG